MSATGQERRRLFSPFIYRLFTWRMARRALIGVACFATLLAMLYTEENWRGKRAWERCKANLESRGYVMDWNALIPAQVPEDQNIFKAPRMQEWFVGRGSNELSGFLSPGNVSSLLTRGPTREEAANFLAWCQTVDDTLQKIHDALKRPYARMDGNYRKAFEMPIPNFVNIRYVAQTLALRARCHIMMGQPHQAVQDLALIHDLNGLLEGKPTGKPMTLVAAMIKVAVCGLYADTIAEGFKQNAWREPDLVALSSQLADTDCLPQVLEALTDERVAQTSEFVSLDRKRLIGLFEILGSKTPTVWQILKSPFYTAVACAPRGWIYQNMVVMTGIAQPMIDTIDPTNHTVMPLKAAEFRKGVGRLKRYSPYDFLALWALPDFVRASQVLAQNQTKVNEAFIVCALERYRVAHGQYPETLDALTPEFANQLPHDLISGQSLHYRRTDDGGFLLYSVGWNETDDNGHVVMHSDGKPDLEKGDWVWGR